ncbi:MAG: hypothetical protein MI747_12745 [Desulfobacterales bacterium]|nr:hypothetical protein [Desulfobacterales bacterium]
MAFMGLRDAWIKGAEFDYNGEQVKVISMGVLMNASGPRAIYRLNNGKNHVESVCMACVANMPVDGPRSCPICGQTFKGKGWGGMAQHWKARHQDIMPYESFRESLCGDHR